MKAPFLSRPKDKAKEPDSTFRNEALITEYKRICDDIRSFETQSDKILNLGVGVVSLSALVGVHYAVALIFFMIPVATSVVVLYTILTYCHIQSMGGYKRYIEDQINVIVTDKLLVWEAVVTEREKHNLVRNFLLTTYAIAVVGLMGASVYYVNKEYGRYPMYAILALIALFFVAIYISVRKLTKINDQTYANARTFRGSGTLDSVTAP